MLISVTPIYYRTSPTSKIRRAFLPHPPARRESESRRFEKISRGKTNPLLPQKMFCFASSAFRPATCPNTWRAEHQRKMSFPFEKKLVARKSEKQGTFFLGGAEWSEVVAGHPHS